MLVRKLLQTKTDRQARNIYCDSSQNNKIKIINDDIAKIEMNIFGNDSSNSELYSRLDYKHICYKLGIFVSVQFSSRLLSRT
jgi:hypothetical protein